MNAAEPRRFAHAAAGTSPRRLTVLYDGDCQLCRRARRWLEQQPKWVALEFLPAGGEAARRRFPTLDVVATLTEMHVVDDIGRLYKGEKAWIVCLWALQDHRGHAQWLSDPRRQRDAKRFVQWLSRHRHRVRME